MLTEYIRQTAERVIAEKQSSMKLPAMCTIDDLVSAFRTDALNEMRALCKGGEFRGHITINKIPMIEKI